jgi:hypothetical protein
MPWQNRSGKKGVKMFTPAVQAALVVLVAFLLDLGAKALGIPLSTEMLSALAAAIVAWLLGVPAGERVSARLRGVKG